MLSTLHIENIAVIEQAEIAFDSGFNVLTGETGAGKSIVIDAISAILGERASREMIRTGAQKAFVSAISPACRSCRGSPRTRSRMSLSLAFHGRSSPTEKQLPRQRQARHSLHASEARRPAHPDPWPERFPAAVR